eukprot:6072828-Alexandrium_andersonii.AAC.1
MSASLVGSEMCIRDSRTTARGRGRGTTGSHLVLPARGTTRGPAAGGAWVVAAVLALALLGLAVAA